MRKINKSSGENALTHFAVNHPNGTWDEFKDTVEYKSLKTQLFEEQNFLCAYCEIDLTSVGVINQRIEHFNSKAASTNDENLHLDWFNLLGVCLGGSNSKDEYPLPLNLSCDSHKAYLERNTPQYWTGKVLSPLFLPPDFSLFLLEKSTGKLQPNEDHCNLIEFEENIYESTFELVEKTIDTFNLNCDRLNKARLKVLFNYERVKKKCREKRDRSVLENLVNRWSGERPLFFQTVRDLLVIEAKLILEKI